MFQLPPKHGFFYSLSGTRNRTAFFAVIKSILFDEFGRSKHLPYINDSSPIKQLLAIGRDVEAPSPTISVFLTTPYLLILDYLHSFSAAISIHRMIDFYC